MHVPGETLTVKETTINMYAAIDIVEAKLHSQLRKYKGMHASPRLHQRMLARLKHRPAIAD
jgi:ribosome-associated translation inhibitor RaiA